MRNRQTKGVYKNTDMDGKIFIIRIILLIGIWRLYKLREVFSLVQDPPKEMKKLEVQKGQGGVRIPIINLLDE